MKRTLLDITKQINRKFNDAELTPIDLTNSTYWIWEATNWRFVEVLRELEYRTNQVRIGVKINTQDIGKDDYVVEQGKNGIIVKFIKSNFEYQLDELDFIEIRGDIEYYA